MRRTGSIAEFFRPGRTPVSAFVLVCGISACSTANVRTDIQGFDAPDNWVRTGFEGDADGNWLEIFGDSEVTVLVTEVLENNFLLSRERALLEEAAQNLTLAQAAALPAVGLRLDPFRRSGQEPVAPGQLNLNTEWELDMWGRLSDSRRSARLGLAAQQARLEQVRRRIVADTVSAYFNAIESVEFLALAQRRLANAIESHDIVNRGYLAGINEALDLYLARNQVELAETQLADRQQVLLEKTSSLQLILGRYPDGNMTLESELPVLSESIATGIPSDLLTRRADLQKTWLGLLALDAELAIAHKNRFPRIVLTGNSGLTEGNFSGSALLWSLVGGISQPLFDAGRLRSLEAQAAARVAQREQVYLEAVFKAFGEVENAISRSRALESSHLSALQAQANAENALTLALEQYQRGLTPYTTVLESQQRAFDSAAIVVRLENALIQNRIRLHLALGGEYTTGGRG